MAKGDVEEALTLQQERLEVNRMLGNLDGQASTLWDLAQIALAQKNINEAAPMLAEAEQALTTIQAVEPQ